MAKAYLIGGAPRVGKSTLAMSVIKDKPMMAASTDALRYVLRRTDGAQNDPGLFVIHNHNNDDTEMARYLLSDSQQVLTDQIQEIMSVWPAVQNYIKSNLEDGWDVIIEGIHVLPELLTDVDFAYSAVFMGNQSPQHVSKVREHAKDTTTDWLHAHSDDVIQGWAQFIQLYSRYISDEALKYGMHYIEMRDEDFNADMNSALDVLLSHE